jgi:phosphomannomutase
MVITNFLFDVDGTLTPSRAKMDKEFSRFFGQWVSQHQCKDNNVFFVTGSDKEKTIEQVGISIYRLIDGSYQSCGNELYVRNRLIKSSTWKMPAHLHLDILEILSESQWYGRADNNIEERAGMVNISSVGRGASKPLRKEYHRWDTRVGERESIVDELSYKYPELDFCIGGEISIDIYPKGRDKSQVLSDMTGRTIFFGDRCEKGGNDFTIATMSDISYNVNSWRQTYEILNKML